MELVELLNSKQVMNKKQKSGSQKSKSIYFIVMVSNLKEQLWDLTNLGDLIICQKVNLKLRPTQEIFYFSEETRVAAKLLELLRLRILIM